MQPRSISPMLQASAFFTLWLGLATVVAGKVFSPRVVPSHQADTHSLVTFAQFEAWKDLSGDAKVYRIYEYLTDPRTGIYPMGVPAREGPEGLTEYSAVRDPVKMLNVYPIGHCGTLGPTVAGLMEGMGIGLARTLILPGWNHVAAEVFYDDQWHYLDLDVRAVFRRADGSLASMAQAQREAALWQRASGARFFPLDEVSRVREVYAKTAVEHRYGFGSGGHTMDYVLRQGETFTRWWQPQGGRWNHHASYGAKPFPRDLIEREPRGPKCKHPSFTRHSHGNGRFVYRPDLTRRSTDFADGVYAARNVEPGPDGLRLKEAGSGDAIFEVRTPYVIVPRVGDLDRRDDDREASVVQAEATGATLALSLDNGITWEALGAASGRHDLTAHVAGRYGYLLKIESEGEPAGAVVRRLEITTWVQLHPAALPALRQGRNTLRYVTGDHHGLNTRVVEVRPFASAPAELAKYLAEVPADYDPSRRTSRIRGPLVARLESPPATQIAWFSAGASFATDQQADARNTRNTIAYAVERPANFREIYRAAIPPDQSHWHYNVDREVKLDEPARAVFVRYVGDPALNNIRLCAHCLEDHPRPASPVHVTHAWKENGQLKTRRFELKEAGGYEIVAEAEPVNEWVEFSVPSEAAPATAGSKGDHAGIRPPVQPWFPQGPSLPRSSPPAIRVSSVDELVRAVETAKPGTTILVAEGRYFLPRYVEIRADDVTLRGESGRAERVVLDGGRSRHGELIGISRCSGVTLADLTLQNVRWNGVKLNSDTGVQRVTLHRCILHNIWQRAVKGVRVPPENREALRPKDCRIQYCLFYNDRPKQYADDPADRPDNFGGNYVGGIDVMYPKDWVIRDNVFIGIQGRTRGGRGAVFLWHEAEGCLVERNIIIDCDVGIALGNSHRPPDVRDHCIGCVARNNFVTRAPETGILADYTRDCRILHNTIHDPTNRLRRLIRVVHENRGLVVANNLLSGPDLRNESSSRITFQRNLAANLTGAFRNPGQGDLHLKAHVPEIVDQALPFPEVATDIGGRPRGPKPDIGAHEFGEGSGPSPLPK